MAWYPWYPELYESDTLGLSLSECGAYRRLIDKYMILRRPLPNDDAALARLIGVGINEWQSISVKVRGFFISREKLLHHKRCDSILDSQDKRARLYSEKAKIGAKVRWNKNNELNATGTQQAMPVDAKGQDKTRQDRIKKVSKTLATRLRVANGFENFYLEYPKHVGRGAAVKALDRALKKTTLEAILEGVRRYAKYCRDRNVEAKFIAHPATWLNQERWADELDEENPAAVAKRINELEKERRKLAASFDDVSSIDLELQHLRSFTTKKV